MAWCGLEGHDAVVERFRRSLVRGRLASSYLFIGPPGIGKRAFAGRLAQGLLCERQAETELAPCLECPSCQQVAADSHPDVIRVERPEGKSFIPIELFIGDREHRSREGLCHRISLRPSSGRRRIAIIDDADWMNQEGANSLLKTLEEPPPRSVLILIGTALQRQLPTIRSRCQIVRFQPLTTEFVKQYVLAADLCQDEVRAQRLAELSEGSLDRAREFADSKLLSFADEIEARWGRAVPETVSIAKEIQAFVDAAGRDAPPRRNRLRQLLQLSIGRLRQEILELTRRMSAGDGDASADECSRALTVADRRLDRCLLALQEIDANANLATLIECWTDDLGQAYWHQHPTRRATD
jgi:DNA polymerase III subunit delta'